MKKEEIWFPKEGKTVVTLEDMFGEIRITVYESHEEAKAAINDIDIASFRDLGAHCYSDDRGDWLIVDALAEGKAVINGQEMPFDRLISIDGTRIGIEASEIGSFVWHYRPRFSSPVENDFLGFVASHDAMEKLLRTFPKGGTVVIDSEEAVRDLFVDLDL